MPGLVAEELVTLVQKLLPGFIAAWVFYGLTAYGKPNTFERTVQALIYTIFVQVIMVGVKYLCLLAGQAVAFGAWSENVQLVWSVVVALVMGVGFAAIANNNTIHKVFICRNWWLRLVDQNNRWTWTKQSAYPSEWFRAFNEGPAWIVLHLRDRRRLYGKALEWPNRPDEGHFLISDADWLVTGEGGGQSTVSVGNVWATLVPASDVVFVDFVQTTDREVRDERSYTGQVEANSGRERCGERIQPPTASDS